MNLRVPSPSLHGLQYQKKYICNFQILQHHVSHYNHTIRLGWNGSKEWRYYCNKRQLLGHIFLKWFQILPMRSRGCNNQLFVLLNVKQKLSAMSGSHYLWSYMSHCFKSLLGIGSLKEQMKATGHVIKLSSCVGWLKSCQRTQEENVPFSWGKAVCVYHSFRQAF